MLDQGILCSLFFHQNRSPLLAMGVPGAQRKLWKIISATLASCTSHFQVYLLKLPYLFFKAFNRRLHSHSRFPHRMQCALVIEGGGLWPWAPAASPKDGRVIPSDGCGGTWILVRVCPTSLGHMTQNLLQAFRHLLIFTPLGCEKLNSGPTVGAYHFE